jgi:DNA-binding protein H-NS
MGVCMALKETVERMQQILNGIARDLHKADQKGNKTAAQRVRTATIKLEKIGKTYRKESIAAERKMEKSAKKSSSKSSAKKR